MARCGLVAAAILLGACLAILASFSPPELPMVASATSISTASASSVTHLLKGNLHDINGQSFDLASLRGRTSVLYFASIDSIDAVTTAEELNALAQLYPSESGVQIVSLNLDIGAGKRHEPLAVRVHARMLEAAFPTLLDVDSRVAGAFDIEKAGHFLVIDSQGNVVYRGPFAATTPEGESRRFVADAVRQVMHPASSDPTLVALQRRPS